MRDVKVVPPLALHADEPLERFKFITPGDPVPADLDVLVVPREQQIVPDPRFRPVAQIDQWLLYGTGNGLLRGPRGAVSDDPVATFDAWFAEARAAGAARCRRR